MEGTYHQQLRELIDEYVHEVYRLTRIFPRDELYGVTSQFRRASLSVALNYIEGYARIKDGVHKNFLEIAYGSLKESRYLIGFSFKEGYISKTDSQVLEQKADRIGAMLWSTMERVGKDG